MKRLLRRTARKIAVGALLRINRGARAARDISSLRLSDEALERMGRNINEKRFTPLLPLGPNAARRLGRRHMVRQEVRARAKLSRLYNKRRKKAGLGGSSYKLTGMGK